MSTPATNPDNISSDLTLSAILAGLARRDNQADPMNTQMQALISAGLSHPGIEQANIGRLRSTWRSLLAAIAATAPHSSPRPVPRQTSVNATATTFDHVHDPGPGTLGTNTSGERGRPVYGYRLKLTSGNNSLIPGFRFSVVGYFADGVPWEHVVTIAAPTVMRGGQFSDAVIYGFPAAGFNGEFVYHPARLEAAVAGFAIKKDVRITSANALPAGTQVETTLLTPEHPDIAALLSRHRHRAPSQNAS